MCLLGIPSENLPSQMGPYNQPISEFKDVLKLYILQEEIPLMGEKEADHST